ncbi:hypothetical protein Tco_0477873, partial [Tanacetum coccineum]
PAVAPPTRTDEQILPRIRWVPIGKSNCYLDAEKSQSNPIYKIAVDILKHTNFFRAFTASSTIPAIYIQQFWDTICYDRTDGGYKCQLDEQWFNLTKDTLRDALQITPVNNNKAFSSPPTQDTLINFVNDLEHSRQSLIYALRERLLGLKGQELQCCRFFGASSIELISIIIRGADYYDAYLEKVAKHKRYLAGEEVSDLDSPAPKPAKSTKPKVTKQAKPVAPKASIQDQSLPFICLLKNLFWDISNLVPKEPKGKSLGCLFRMSSSLMTFEEQITTILTDEKVANIKDNLAVKKLVGPDSPSKILKNNLNPRGKLTWKVSTTSRSSGKGKGESRCGASCSDKEMPPVVKSGDQDEGQAGPDLGIQDKGQAEPNTDDVAESHPLSTLGVHAGPNLEHTNAEATDATRTLSSLQHLAKDFSFGDQFFNDKPSEADNEKTTVDTEAEYMMSVTIHQDTSDIPPMTSPVIYLVSRPDSPNVHQPLPTTTTATATTTTIIMTTIPLPPQPQQGSSDSILINRLGEFEQHIADLVDANQALEERLDKHGSRLYRLENQDIPNQVSKAVDEIVTDAVDWAMQAPLRERFRDLPEADMTEFLHNQMWESKSYQTHEDHMTLYGALEKSMARDNSDQLLSDLAKSRKKKKKRQGSPKTPLGSPPHPPPPPLPPAGPSRTLGASGVSITISSSTSIQQSGGLKLPVSPIPEELHMDDDTTADEQAYTSSGEDVGRDIFPL